MFTISKEMPRKRSPFLRFLGGAVNRFQGWKFEGEMADEPKLIFALAPHTSNWDFFIGVPLIMKVDADVAVFMKQEAFFWPFKGLLRWIGFVPVDRKAGNGVVDEAIIQFREHEKFWLVITPEGTRKNVTRWKKGFLRISKNAGVPIQILGIDYPSKTIQFGPVFHAGEDIDKDIEFCKDHTAQFQGRHPQ